MNPVETIESAERDYQQLLEIYFSKHWGKTVLSSHDINHHRRVWYYSRELLTKTLQTGNFHINFPPHKLLIACYLHDLGMISDRGTEHGIHSRHLCGQFLELNNFSLSEYSDLLSAIEYHDRKDYGSPGRPDDLVTILSVADDLDAFGFIGIYRYMEIYLKRGISPDKACDLIRENATKRFSNFFRVYGFLSDLAQIHKERFETLDRFFAGYSKQLHGHRSRENRSGGHCGVIELISSGVSKDLLFDGILDLLFVNSSDPVINWFFLNLKEESKSYIRNE